MRKIVTAALSAMMVLFAGVTAAQDEQEALDLTFSPVETFTCDFRDGQGPADLTEVIEEWNAWMDEQGRDDYFAITLWPAFYGELNFDVGWLGVWPSGNAMGADIDNWVTDGQEMNANFMSVLDCTSHTQFASVQVKEPPESDMEPGDTFVLTFSNCSMEEEKEFSEYLAAQDEWNSYADANGFGGGAWVLFPIWGESVEADYDFKAVSSAASYSSLGADWQLYADGHYQKSDEIYSGLLDCDSSRVYSARVERLMADGE